MDFADFQTAQKWLVIGVWTFIGFLVAGGLLWCVLDTVHSW